jgi:hypothetical protein
MAGHSRPKDGVASARLSPAIHVFASSKKQDADARHKAGHDGERPYFAATTLSLTGRLASSACKVVSVE